MPFLYPINKFKFIGMTPIHQTIFHTEDTRGNCMSACFASFLDVPIEDVPYFAEMERDEWVAVLLKFFKLRGYDLEWTDDEPYVYREILTHDKVEVPEFYFATGKSPRGVGHMVIFSGDKMFHDPHPNGDGIGKPDGYFYPIKIKDKK